MSSRLHCSTTASARQLSPSGVIARPLLEAHHRRRRSDTARVRNEAACVNIYPTLLPVVRQRGLETVHRAYLLLKSFDLENNGVVPKAEALGLLQEIMSRSSVYRVLKRGEGTFWRTINGRLGRALMLTGIVKLIGKLDPDFLSSWRVLIPLQDLVGRNWRGALHAAELRKLTRLDHPVSRQTIKRLTGLSEATQRRYCHAVPIKRTYNYADRQRPCRIHPESHPTHQLPNAYEVALEAGRSGQLKVLKRRNSRRNAASKPAPSWLGKPRYVKLSKNAGNRVIRLLGQGFEPVYLRSRSNSRWAWWESFPTLSPSPKSDCPKGQGGRGSGTPVDNGRSEVLVMEATRAPAVKTGHETPADILKRIRRWSRIEVIWLTGGGSGCCLWCARTVDRGMMIVGGGGLWHVHADCLRPKVADLLEQLVRAP